MDYLSATASTWSLPAKRKLVKSVRGVIAGLERFGNISEAVTRLALRERAMKNYLKQGMSQEEAQRAATLAARRYMDYGQGGRYAKAVDNFLPYFNAGIQGNRAWMRGAKRYPKQFTAKLLQIGGASAGLTTYNIVNNPEALDAIPDRIKASNWCITTPIYRISASGAKEYGYFTIPKPPGIGSVFSIFENLAEAALGRDVSHRQTLMAMDDVAGVGSIPPAASIPLALMANVDTYTWEEIYQGGSNIDKEAEIKTSTPEWAIRAGEITGQSPERIRNAKSKLFTYRNGLYDASSATIDMLYSKMTDQEVNETTEEITDFSKMPIIRRFWRYTSSEVAIEKVDENMREYFTRRKRQKLKLDDLIKDIDGELPMSIPKNIEKYVQSQPEEDRSSIKTRYMNLAHHADIPRYLININWATHSSPETKAMAMYTEWAKSDDKEKLEEQLRGIKGIGGARFWRTYEHLKKEHKRN